MAHEAELFALEQRLALVGQTLSADEAAALIADDFFEFGASGRVWTKPEVVPAIATWPTIEREVVDFRVRALGDGHFLVTYTAIRWPDDPRRRSQARRSSIWRWQNGGWQIAFHQGTPVPA